MGITDSVKYCWNVKITGQPFLHWQRRQTERHPRIHSHWRSDILSPPLRIGARTKELISRHYLEGRYASGHRPVAWVTSGGPVEILQALGFYVLYPENHGALCGVRKAVVEIAGEAENAGYSTDICSYARTDIGAMLSGKTPVGRLPKPDLLLACTNICQTVLYWYRVLAKHFKVPLILIDTPFVYTKTSDHALEYVKKQLENSIPIAEQAAGQALDYHRLKEIIKLSKDAAELWREIIDRGRHHPAPISVFDQFIHMAPIVEMRGRKETVDFYAALLEELDENIAKGIGAVRNERKRLLWDNLPIWYRLRYFAEYLGEHGICVVASTYTNAWAELAPMMNPRKPLESMTRTYIHPILNQGTKYKLDTMKKMVKDFQLDGVILHSDRSCKPYSIGQIDQRNLLIQEYGIPALLLEADHDDPRAYAEEQIASRLAAFVEMLMGS
ncbi:MAG: 2-hydroxyacyl-CoA dehydratase [Deltaproteobacteria bacterium]|nr:2-hydroxyacyl-CoA dehydratase [Candidatus Tharpella sp.]